MKLMVRYDDDRQYLELSTQDMDDLWLSLSVEDGDYTPEEREKILQEAFDAEFNRPDYNCHHRWKNHRGYSAAAPRGGDDGVECDEPLMQEAADPTIFTKYADRHELEENYQETCRMIHSVLGTKTKWADAVIAVRLDGMKVGDYAASIGLKDASVVSKWLMRAEKKLRKHYEKRQISGPPAATY